MTVTTERAIALAQRIKLPNGIELPYVEQGDPAGVSVLFLHGYSDSWHSFEPMLPHLPPSIHAIALTLRGHGDATRPVAGYAMADYAADVINVADALGLDRFVVAGHSMGAIAATKLAIDYPERILGFVGIGTLVDSASNPVLNDLWNYVAPLTDPIDRAFAWEFQESTLAQPIPTEFLERFVDESMKLPARVWKAALAGILATNHTDEINGISAPALMIWGDRDEMATLSEQYSLVAASPRGRLVVYEGAGHAAHWEEPARVAADIAAFIAEITD